MSRAWFQAVAKDEHIEVRRGGRQPGVNWTDVERFVARSRITRLDQAVLRQIDVDDLRRGVSLMDAVRRRFDWSDHDIADALGVNWSTVSKYRLTGLPDRQVSRLRKLASLNPENAALPRRQVWASRLQKRASSPSRT